MLENPISLPLSDAEFLFAHTKMQNTKFNQLVFSVLQNSTEEQKFIRGTDRGLHFCKETNKICKNALFFRFLSLFAFRCMVKWPLIGVEIAPAIAMKFSGLV